ncbi:carboxypeptidase-like regulatory domain-containing protein [Panacibacter ginsenosidivorans]|nr:carboxypeptidase-like regulatory domain-containing protein [Panacibacter ginsenosidivorans]
MKAQTYFHIPTPCHENWENMTPEGKGRFCDSCSKQVVDFSLMSDQQVLNYFKNASGKTCGRFANDQLQRPMVEVAEQKKKVWWVAAVMPLLMLFGRVNAQKKIGKVKLGTPVKVIPDNRPEIMEKVSPEIIPVYDTIAEPVKAMGDTILSYTTNELIIKGTLTDMEKGDVLPYASIVVKNSKIGTASDMNGNFSLKMKNNGVLPVLILAYVGYETKEIDLNKYNGEIVTTYENGTQQVSIKSEMTRMQTALTGDVVVTTGLTIVCRKPKPIDTAKTVVNKILKKEAFKIFPNPVTKGQQIQLEIKKAGEYSIQLLDNNAGLVLVKDFSAANDNSTIEITIPYSVIPGMYFILLIDKNKKKQYTDKLIVQ